MDLSPHYSAFTGYSSPTRRLGATPSTDTASTPASDPYAFTPASTSTIAGGSGKNPAAAGLKNLAPLDYAALVHQYQLYNQLQPDLASSIQEAMQHLQDPQAQLSAMREGLLSHVPEAAGQTIAGLQAYGAGDSAKQGAFLNAQNQANMAANAAEAQAASPAGNMDRLRAIAGLVQAAAPNIQNLLAMSQNAGPTQSGNGFLGGLISTATSMIPSLIPGKKK